MNFSDLMASLPYDDSRDVETPVLAKPRCGANRFLLYRDKPLGYIRLPGLLVFLALVLLVLMIFIAIIIVQLVAKLVDQVVIALAALAGVVTLPFNE